MSFFCNKHFLVKGAGLASERYFFRLCTGFGKLFFGDCIFHCMNCVLLLLLLLVGMHHGVYRFAGNFIYFLFSFCMLCVVCMMMKIMSLSHNRTHPFIFFLLYRSIIFLLLLKNTIPSGLLGEFCGGFYIIYINCVHFFSVRVFGFWVLLNWIRGLSGERWGFVYTFFSFCERWGRGWWHGICSVV